ncbi:MAG: microviridin/marinostatin family tricyclic proteinase inhibitor [Bacteroidales bacterium]|nr:microviridin/marinostatin family tricyclic proteinase inhibitor [Bacteroidales bacterium]
MKKKPFFANFLENQIETSDVKGGEIVTMKYPSDNDELGPIITDPEPITKPPVYVTMKHPSDSDEGGGVS